LLSPDGYYTYLNVPKVEDTTTTAAAAAAAVDEELIKKNYRKLSLKHHPDRPDGDAETFHVLNRAQKVLLHPKMRQQYDLLGIDLDEEDEDKPDDSHGNDDNNTGTTNNSTNNSSSSSGPETVISHIASATLATILQVMVRTAMMGLTAVILVRYRILLFPAVAFLVFVAYRVHFVTALNATSRNSMETLSPLMIGVGLVLMYRGRSGKLEWSQGFWIGEALVLTMFSFNSVPAQRTPAMGILFSAVSFLLTFWLGGKLWRYVTVLGVEALIAIMCALAFPIMELILEQIMMEKLKKVGAKIRLQNERYQAYYAAHPVS